jgi:tetratricopeptide (TPR) repeat protein
MNSSSETPISLASARQLAADRRWADLARLSDHVEVMGPGETPELEYLLADALRRVGRSGDAIELAHRAERGASRNGDRRLLLRAINLLGMLAFESGSLVSAGEWFDKLLERATEWTDDEFVARASNNLGILANVRGERELAMTFYQRATAAYHRLGHLRGIAQTSYNLGISFRDLAFPEEAERHYVQAIRYAEMSKSEDVIALAETERAYLRVLSGDGALAESMAARALERHRSMEDPGGSANAMRVLARAAEVRGELDLALRRLEQASALTERCDDPLLGAEVQRDRARVLHGLGEYAAAKSALLDSVETFSRLGAPDDAREATALLQALFPIDAQDPPRPL